MEHVAVPGSVSALDDETAARAGWLGRVGAAVAGGLRAAWSYRAVRVASPLLAATLTLWPPLALVHHVYFDRGDLPELAPFVLFQPPTTGEVTDARGEVVVQLAREYRRVVTYDEVPLVVRQAILAAEDKNFHSHSGVDYGALPRVIQKTVARSLAEWRTGSGLRLRLPQGGSTITQQLVRVYFLPYLTARRDDDALFARGLTVPRLMSAVLGAPATNKLLRKLEEVRLALWLEEAMRREYRTREQAKREIFSRYASFIYMGSGRYGFGAASEYYFDKPLATYTTEDAGRAALLAGIGKSPRVYAPATGNPRARQRRNQILALMARNGYIPEDLARRCQAEPIGVVRRALAKTEAPAAIDHVLDELQRHGGALFTVEDLFQGRIRVRSTVDQRVQRIVNGALENGLARYENRHPKARGLIQGSVVVLANADAAILAEAGGRQLYNLRSSRYSDYNRVTGSLRQPGSVMKPLVYLAAFRSGLTLDATVPDEPISRVPWLRRRGQVDRQLRRPLQGSDPRPPGVGRVPQRGRGLGCPGRRHGQGHPDMPGPGPSHAAQPLCQHGARRVRGPLARARGRLPGHGLGAACGASRDRASQRQHRHPPLRGPRSRRGASPGEPGPDPGGAAGCRPPSRRNRPRPQREGVSDPGDGQDGHDERLPGRAVRRVDLRGAGHHGRGADRLRRQPHAGLRETGGRTALPIFREILMRVYADALVGTVPQFPREMEDRIDAYLATEAGSEAAGPAVAAGPVADHRLGAMDRDRTID